MSGLERPIDAPVYFSTLIDGAAQFCKLLTDVVEQPPRPMTRSMHVESLCELAGSRIDDGINNDHRRASDEVARPLPVIAAPRSPKICPRLHLAYAWPDLAGKASEPSRDSSYPLSYLSWQGLAKSSARSEQMASWFTEWVCHADVMQALAGCSALPRKACGEAQFSFFGIDSHQSTVPGSHRALPGTHGGGHSGRRTAPTAWTVPTSASRCGKGVNAF